MRDGKKSLGIRVGIMAPSAPCGQVELALGVRRLRDAGFEVFVHPQTKKRGPDFCAGTDPDRAQAFWDLAMDDSIDVIWCARGGYGAFRMMQILDRMAKEKGMAEGPRKKKTLVGYSDVTALHSYVGPRWGWRTIHGWMAGTRDFSSMPEKDFDRLVRAVQGADAYLTETGLEKDRLTWLSSPKASVPTSGISGKLVGGNLTVWLSLFGTPLAPVEPAPGETRILFLEEIDEAPYRVDRLVNQLVASGGLKGVQAVVVGTMTGFEDRVFQVLKTEKDASKKKPQMKPLRPKVAGRRSLEVVFKPILESGIPVAVGLPIGHGGGSRPLPLNVSAQIQGDRLIVKTV
ncbi:MAG: LD-carboxypeptidase [Bdellovibrionales bacterium]|nr:LD-carboxypeptidase [Bdellovibrionales bacterium]